MKLPTIHGIIDRRILVNFRVGADVAARQRPQPFRPVLVGGYAVAGVFLIRLRRVRPAFVPAMVGVGSENAAHRFAVEWDDGGETRTGVYVPRRDSSSRLNSLLGGRLVPGVHHHARFDVKEADEFLQVSYASDDGRVRVSVSGRVAEGLPSGSVFRSVEEASEFFQRGTLGYSATATPGRFDGLELKCKTWAVRPLAVEDVQSSYFADRSIFPEGSVTFDCALLMRDVEHEWHSRKDLCCS